jgi:outer membrane autotransporter protein
MSVSDDMPNAFDGLNDAGNPGVYREAPAADASFSSTQAFADRALLLSDERLNALASGVSSGNATHGVREWGQVFGMSAHQGVREGLQGFDAHTAGIAVGADTANWLSKAVMGASLSYGHTNADPRDPIMAKVNIDNYQLTLYGDYNLGDHAYLRGMLAYGRSDNDTIRPTFSLPAHGNFGANEFTALAKTGRAYAYGKATLTPSLLARWVHYDPESYTETGAGFDNLHVSQNSLDIFEAGPGLDATWKVKNDDGSWLVPSAHAGYRYDFIGDRITTAFADCCSTTVANGPTPARSRFNLGTSLTWYTTSTWEFKAAYDYDYRQDYAAHSGLLRGTFRY